MKSAKVKSLKNTNSFQKKFLTINIDRINNEVPVSDDPVENIENEDHGNDSDY